MILLQLIVQDPVFGIRLTEHLRVDGFDPMLIPEPDAAGMLLRKHAADLIVLDFYLTSVSGFQVLGDVRSSRPTTPILVFGLSGDADEEADALHAGAADYIRRPINLAIVTARKRARLQRGETPSAVIHSGPVTLDPLRQIVLINESVVDFPPKAFDLLHALMRARGHVVTTQELLSAVWGLKVEIDTETVKYHIGEIRRILRPFDLDPAVVTVRKKGFAWRPQE